MISDFCRVRVAPHLPPRDTAKLLAYLTQLIATRTPPPRLGPGYDWVHIAFGSGVPADQLAAVQRHVVPALDVLCRQLPRAAKVKPRKAKPPAAPAPLAQATAP